MFTKLRNLESIVDGGVILIVRLDDADEAYEVSKAAIAGGIRALEITYEEPTPCRHRVRSRIHSFGGQLLW